VPLLQEVGAVCGRADDQVCRAQSVRALAEVYPGLPQAVVPLARLALRQGKPEAALSLLEALLSRRPDSFTAHRLRARVLEQLGRGEAAISALDQALVLSPGLVGVLEERGRILEGLGRDDDAIQSYAEALKIAPERRELDEKIKALQPQSAGFEAAFRWDPNTLLPEEGAADERQGQDYYFIGRQEVVKVAPSGRSIRYTQEIIHILTPKGARDWSTRRLYYSPGFERVEIASIKVRKENGAVSEAYRRTDYDAGTGSGNLYYLRKFAQIELPALKGGDVIEFSWFETEVGDDNFREGYFGALFYFDASVDVERARFAVVSAPEMPLFSHLSSPGVTASDQRRQSSDGAEERVRSWEVSGLPRVQTDGKMPGRAEVFSHVLVSTYETWDQVGVWWWNLIKDQLIVDAEIKARVKELTDGVTDDREKVRVIHEWVVKNTRYVGIEFGVHGWKPYRTTLCFRRRFGDCKDKASLIKVMLDAAGVETNLVLLRTRRLGGITQVPPSLTIFNHAIAYVPQFDLYLDGTAEFSGTEELPFADQGQLSLIVADGGKVTVRITDVNPSEKNTMVRTLDVDLTLPEPLVTGRIEARGGDAVFYRRRFDTVDQRRETLESVLSRAYPGAKLRSSRFESVTDINKPVKVEFTFTGGGFIKESGASRFLLPAGRHFRMLNSYASQASRDQDLMLGAPFQATYILTYRLPPKTRPAALPEEASEQTQFGSFRIARELKGNLLRIEVSYTFSTERIGVADYPGFRDWLGRMDRALSQPIVLEEVQDE
jgi:tetratricopeptide (TPR) repeat protein